MNKVKIVDNDIKFVVGEKALENIAYEITTAGCSRPMLVCDDMSNRVGLKKILLKAFNGSGIDIVYIDQKLGDIATTEDVERIVRLYNSNNCDCMILLGKKALISAGKASKVLIRDGVSIVAQYDGKNLSKYPVKDFPLFVVPTYLGSGIECSNKVRIYNPDGKIVYDFDSSYASTSAVFIDDRLTDIMPPKAIASFGFYALAMSVEAYTKSENKIYAKPYAMAAMHLLKENLMPCVLHNANNTYRKEVMAAVVIAGCAYYLLDRPFLTVLTDVISDRYKANYANIMALLFKSYVLTSETYEDNKALGELLPIVVSMEEYSTLNIDDASKFVKNKILSFYESINDYVDCKDRLRDFGVDKSDFPEIAEQVISVADDNTSDEYSYAYIMSLLERAY